MSTQREMKRLSRSDRDRVIAGVAGGLGEYLEVDSLLFRILFVIFGIFGGSGIVLYLVLWIMLPSKGNTEKTLEETMKMNTEELKKKAEEITSHMERDHGSKGKKGAGRMTIGIFLLIIGVLLLLQNVGYIHILHFFKLWPLILIAVALAMIL